MIANGTRVKMNRRTLKIEIENYLAMTKGFEKDGKIIKTSIFTSKPRSTALKNGLSEYPQLLTLSRTTPSYYRYNKKIVNQFRLNYKPDLRYHYSYSYDPYGCFKEHFFKNIKSYRYVVFIDTMYSLEKDFSKQIALWDKLCSNDLFDQWRWSAPFGSFLKEKIHSSKEYEGLANIFSYLSDSRDITDQEKDALMREFVDDPLILLLRVYVINKELDITSDINTCSNTNGQSTRFNKINSESKCAVVIEKPVISDDSFDEIRHKLESTIEECGMDIRKRHVNYKHCLSN